MMVGAILCFMILPILALAQETKTEDVWKRLRFFVGSWEGTGTGEPGTSMVEREYHFVLGGKFLLVSNRSTYEPQEKNPKGEVHEDWGLFSFDRARRSLVFRQFHSEGFVNQYVQSSQDSTNLVFVSESIENIAPGWRARETYKILGENEFAEIFELAPAGGAFEKYSENHLRRRNQ